MILTIVLCYAIYELSTGKKSKPVITPSTENKATATATSNTTATPNETPVHTASAIPSVTDPKVIAAISAGGWKRDPFRKNILLNPSKADIGKIVEALITPKTDNFALTAISRQGNKSYALINEQIVTVGDNINGFKVIAIQEMNVILKKNDFTFTLSLPEDNDNY